MRPLTKRRLEAIREALNARLAGEIDNEGDSGIKREDYKAALEWAREQIDRRTAPAVTSHGGEQGKSCVHCNDPRCAGDAYCGVC
jgi:hypothetical protein